MDVLAKPVPYPELCAHEIFERQVATAAGAPALLCSSECITYSGLNLRANRVAHELRQVGVKPETRVGVYMHNSSATIVALLGVLKAGGAFVPLDPSFPTERLEYIISDSQLAMVLTSKDLERQVPSKCGHVICVEEITIENSTLSIPDFSSGATLESAACVIYTSGSTGRPKGVIRLHRGLPARLAWSLFRSDDVFCHNMSICYGFSQERLFLPLMAGLPLAILSDEAGMSATLFADAIAKFGVSQVTVVPAFLDQLVRLDSEALSRLSCLRAVAVGGAPVSRELVQRFIHALPEVKLINAYGATESGSVIRGELTALRDSDPISIGAPVQGAEIYILDDCLRPVQADEVGELCVAGPSIARGYLGRPDLTAQRFVRNPFGPGRLYRTGDMARFLADGRIELGGRVDRQVKIRGFRVELEELEAALNGHPGVRESAVACHEINGDNRLIAYVATKDDIRLTRDVLRKFLMDRVPAHMMPSSFLFLPSLPRTPNGKLEQDALPPPPEVRPDLEAPYVAPRNPIESAIAEIWAELLNLDRVGIHDHLLDLGGDSIHAVRIVAEIGARLGFEVPFPTLFEHPTVAEFAARLQVKSCM